MTRHVAPKLPRGVYALALLMFLSGGLLLLAAVILPITGANIMGSNLVPWYLYILYAAYFLALGWGLWSGRRWAYVAALLMCLVLAFYQVQAAIVLGRNALFQIVALAAIFVYLLRPGVRAAFLSSATPADRTEEKQI